MRTIDAHQHYWTLATPGHQWPTASDPAIHRDFGPAELAAHAADVPLSASVLVQSQPTDADTDWMLAMAADTASVAAIVGWVDLATPDAPARIAELAASPKLRGIRPMLQSIADTDWLLHPDLSPAIAAMIDHGLRLDALVQPRHLSMLRIFTRRWPALPVVIDHGAKPFIARGELDPWRSDIAALAHTGMWCKLSGLRTEQGSEQTADGLHPVVEHLVAAFGDRLMWGSDWPVLLLSGSSYREWYDDARRLTGAASDAVMTARLFAGAAAEFYGLDRSNHSGAPAPR